MSVILLTVTEENGKTYIGVHDPDSPDYYADKVVAVPEAEYNVFCDLEDAYLEAKHNIAVRAGISQLELEYRTKGGTDVVDQDSSDVIT